MAIIDNDFIESDLFGFFEEIISAKKTGLVGKKGGKQNHKRDINSVISSTAGTGSEDNTEAENESVEVDATSNSDRWF